MDPKRVKLDPLATNIQCCVCGESSLYGSTDVYSISLRSDTRVLPFNSIILSVIGIEVQQGSIICGSCKQRCIEFYHFKQKSQLTHRLCKYSSQDNSSISSLAQDAIKIVDFYIKKFSITALRIEESDEKLIIMRKPSIVNSDLESQETSTPKIKTEPLDEESLPISVKQMEYREESCIQIKMEPELIIEDIDDTSETTSANFSHHKENTEEKTIKIDTLHNSENARQMNMLIDLNNHILSVVTALNAKIDVIQENTSCQNTKVRETSRSPEGSDVEEGELDDFPGIITAKTLADVEKFNRLLKCRKHRVHLEVLLKQNLSHYENNYEIFLKKGLELLLSKETQFLIRWTHNEQASIKPLAVQCLLNVAQEFFETPNDDLERFVQHLLFLKKKRITRKRRKVAT